jgi:hypothetical protein
MADDDLRSWLEQARQTGEAEEAEGGWWDGEERGGRRRWTLWVLAVLPWLVVAGLALAGSARPAEPVTAPRPVLEEIPDPVAAPPEPPGDEGIAAAAALAVQTAVSGTDEATGRQRYVDLAVASATEWTGDVALVRVAAVVLEGVQGQWDAPRVAAYAVPIRLGAAGPFPVAPPWPLPDVPATAATPEAFAPDDDPGLAEAVGAALRSAGYAGVEVAEVARDPALPGILQARIAATAPGEASARNHTVWLREDPEPALLGTGAA